MPNPKPPSLMDPNTPAGRYLILMRDLAKLTEEDDIDTTSVIEAAYVLSTYLTRSDPRFDEDAFTEGIKAIIADPYALFGMDPPLLSRRRDPSPEDLNDPGDKALYERLRRWRAGEARTAHLAPMHIMRNSVLVNVVRARPRTIAELSRVSGFGGTGARLAMYGDDIIEIVNAVDARIEPPPEEQVIARPAPDTEDSYPQPDPQPVEDGDA